MDTVKCVICGKVWQRYEVAKILDDESVGWLNHKSKGVVCSTHPGIRQWHTRLWKQAQAQERRCEKMIKKSQEIAKAKNAKLAKRKAKLERSKAIRELFDADEKAGAENLACFYK